MLARRRLVRPGSEGCAAAGSAPSVPTTLTSQFTEHPPLMDGRRVSVSLSCSGAKWPTATGSAAAPPPLPITSAVEGPRPQRRVKGRGQGRPVTGQQLRIREVRWHGSRRGGSLKLYPVQPGFYSRKRQKALCDRVFSSLKSTVWVLAEQHFCAYQFPYSAIKI